MSATDVSASFIEHTCTPNAAGSPELEARLAELHAQAQAAWPGVTVSASDFAAHLGRVASDECALLDALDELHTDDLYLAAACAVGDAAAMRTFESRLIPRAAAAVCRVDATPQFVEEICADLRVKLLVADKRSPDIARYLGRGPLAHWVSVAAMRAAMGKKRKKKREIAMDLPDVVDSILEADPELAPFAEQIRQPFAKVFAEALADLSSRERNVLRLYLIDGVSAEGIGKMYRVHRATVARWISKAREKVHKGTKRRLAEVVELRGNSFESVVGVMWQGVDLSLASFLATVSPQTAP